VRRAGYRSTSPLQPVLLPIAGVLGAHQLAMHYSLSLVGKTVIFYHALTKVLGNDKRFSVELPFLVPTDQNAHDGTVLLANAGAYRRSI